MQTFKLVSITFCFANVLGFSLGMYTFNKLNSPVLASAGIQPYEQQDLTRFVRTLNKEYRIKNGIHN